MGKLDLELSFLILNVTILQIIFGGWHHIQHMIGNITQGGAYIYDNHLCCITEISHHRHSCMISHPVALFWQPVIQYLRWAILSIMSSTQKLQLPIWTWDLPVMKWMLYHEATRLVKLLLQTVNSSWDVYSSQEPVSTRIKELTVSFWTSDFDSDFLCVFGSLYFSLLLFLHSTAALKQFYTN